MLPTAEPAWQLGARMVRSPAFSVAMITCLVFAWIVGATTSPRPKEAPRSTGTSSTGEVGSTAVSGSPRDPRFTAGLDSRRTAESRPETDVPIPLGDLPGELPGGVASAAPAEQPTASPDYQNAPQDPDLTAALSGLEPATPEQLMAQQLGIRTYEMYEAQLRLNRQAQNGAGPPGSTPQEQSLHGTLPAAPGPAIAPDPQASPPAATLPDEQPFVSSGQPPGPTG